jgi:hypothetical protein
MSAQKRQHKLAKKLLKTIDRFAEKHRGIRVGEIVDASFEVLDTIGQALDETWTPKLVYSKKEPQYGTKIPRGRPQPDFRSEGNPGQTTETDFTIPE